MQSFSDVYGSLHGREEHTVDAVEMSKDDLLDYVSLTKAHNFDPSVLL